VLYALSLLAEEYPAQAEALHRLAALLADGQGGSIGAAYRDELSGPLQMAATGIAHQDGRLKVTLFLILPVTADGEQLFRNAKACAAGLGIHVEKLRLRPSCCFPADHPAVGLLTDTYNQVMQRESRPFVMSGGNYAAYLPNAFGFGPGLPGRQFPPHLFRPGRGDYHQCDESIDMEQMLDFMRVYAMSIVALDGLETLRL
jgi:succinyl-diaminopimelate desuccinylase